MTNFNGFNVDINGLAEGLLNIIYIHPDACCLVYGMMPADVMASFEKVLLIKIPNRYLKNGEEISGEDVRYQISHAVVSKVLELANTQGFCVV